MSKEKLNQLEADYFDQPLSLRAADLVEINQLRRSLNMIEVDSQLKEIITEQVEKTLNKNDFKKIIKEKEQQEAGKLWTKYLNLEDSLKPYRKYAGEVISKLVSSQGKTPVKPLATMGKHGGALLCDFCEKPIILEGGKFNLVPVDVAWKQNPDPDWYSWISGGLITMHASNGTLRIYHGYMGRKNQCFEKAMQDEEQTIKNHKKPENRAYLAQLLFDYLVKKNPSISRDSCRQETHKILDALYSYDVGTGINFYH